MRRTGNVRRGVCSTSCVDATAMASLITAALDLSVVRLVRGAIAANLDGTPGPLGTVVRSHRGDILPRQVHRPDPRIEPREVISPTPRVEPRETVHLDPRVSVGETPCTAHPTPPAGKSGSDVLPPPWELPVWRTPLPPKPILKLVLHRPDTRHKGTLLDRFA